MIDDDISIRPPSYSDENEFIARMNESINLYRPWVDPPLDSESFKNYIKKYDSTKNISYLVMYGSFISGVININEIIRGNFQSAFLGYYAVSRYSGRGIMRKGLLLVLKKFFNELGLHRVEANIQPGNTRSTQLVSSIGFIKEGFSKSYLKINDQWRDHERWALTYEEWRKNNGE